LPCFKFLDADVLRSMFGKNDGQKKTCALRRNWSRWYDAQFSCADCSGWHARFCSPGYNLIVSFGGYPQLLLHGLPDHREFPRVPCQAVVWVALDDANAFNINRYPIA
jgi:hypothetical protein